MAEYGHFPVQDSGLQRIRSKLTQMRLGGKTVAPYEYSKLLEAEIGAQVARGDSRYATQVRKEENETDRAERIRQFNINKKMTEDAIEDANKGALISAAFKVPAAVATTAKLFEGPNDKTGTKGGIGYKLYKKLFGGPGVITPGSAPSSNYPSMGGPEDSFGAVPNDTPPSENYYSMGGPEDPYGAISENPDYYYNYDDYGQSGYPSDDTDWITYNGSNDTPTDNYNWLGSSEDPYGAVPEAEPEIVPEDDGWCIIVSACHGRYSPEVDITRFYRDHFMSKKQLRGYYVIAERIVPLMKRSRQFTEWMRKHLVKHFIEYGNWIQNGPRPSKAPQKEMIISKLFLALCALTGMVKKRYVRKNGEVY